MFTISADHQKMKNETEFPMLCISLAVATILFCALSGYASAQQKLWTKLIPGKESSSLLYMECAPDDGGEECTTHSLECSREKFSVELGSYESSEVGLILTTLTRESPFESSVGPRINIAGSKGGLFLDFSSITTEYYDIDGLWHLKLTAWDALPFFEALSASNVKSASISFASGKFELAPQPDNGKSLLSFKAACMALAQN